MRIFCAFSAGFSAHAVLFVSNPGGQVMLAALTAANLAVALFGGRK